jgi:3-hydroxyisobutyrate dehydrogenase-like beta-hydroxyacid dehydrogenase
MGRALADAFVAAGHPTTVWNRTQRSEDGLRADVASTATEAMGASPLVIACVTDYPALQSVLDGDTLQGRTLVNFCGGSPEQARAMATWAAEHDIDYLDGVIMSTTNAIGTPEANLYYSGSRSAFETYSSTLSALGENAHHLGEDPGRAAAYDAALQDLLWTSMSGAAHMFALAAAENITAADIAAHAKSLLGFFPDLIDTLAEQLTTGRFSDDGGEKLTSVTAVMDHILSVVRANDLDDGVLTAARTQVQRAIDAGHGSEGFARMAAR